MVLISSPILANHDTQINEKLFIIVTPSYNNIDWWQWNLDSLINQNYTNYRIIITDDCSTDGTGDAIAEYITTNHLENKVTLIRNTQRYGALYNLYTMIHSCPNGAIIVTVDGDDALPDPGILRYLNTLYSTQDVWLTYGQFIEHPSGVKGWCSPMPAEVVQQNSFRQYSNLPSHLRTFYAWLFKKIRLQDMLYFGDFYSMTWDYVMMIPMIEMAAERHACIEERIMYLYNNANAISDHKVSRQLQAHLAQVIRNQKCYSRLPKKQEDFAQNLTDEKADIILFAEEKDPCMVEQCIKSIEKNVIGYDTIYVLYLCWPTTKQQYENLKNAYPKVLFLEIEENRTNFKDLLTSLYGSIIQNNYVVFALPNTLIESPINLNDCIQALEEHHAYNFSLKLSQEKPCSPIPNRMALLGLTDDLCAWHYATANDVWACANNADMTLYRRNTPSIFRILQDCWMYSWIHFVGWWSHEGDLDKVGLCFKYPKTRTPNSFKKEI